MKNLFKNNYVFYVYIWVIINLLKFSSSNDLFNDSFHILPYCFRPYNALYNL